MSNRWIGILGGFGIVGALALSAALLLAPVEPQVPLQPTEGSQVATTDPDDIGVLGATPSTRRRRAERRRPRPVRAQGVDRESLKDRRRARREEVKQEREPLLEAEERAEARRMYREDRLVEVNERLDEVAAERDWDPELTEEVRLVLLDTADRITESLARVAGEKQDWDAVKDDLRDFRMRQARELEALLGPDEFDAFVAGMEFERFSTSPPVRGRLE
jgi:hypothetical protein